MDGISPKKQEIVQNKSLGKEKLDGISLKRQESRPKPEYKQESRYTLE